MFSFPWKMLRFHQTMKMFGQEPSISVQKCSPVGVVAGMLCVPVLPCELTFLACPHLSWCSMVPSLAETMPRTMEVVSLRHFVRNALHMASPAARAGRGHKALRWQLLGDTVRRFPSWISRPPATLWSLVERWVITQNNFAFIERQLFHWKIFWWKISSSPRGSSFQCPLHCSLPTQSHFCLISFLLSLLNLW